MKVLFAVSNDNITTSVVNKYQQKYKEIVTVKNVYYFNAIVKELQIDKSYDAIVIEEDLEPISNNNYDAIDKFLFEKLDNISDEASKPTGEDIPIIFLCSDRRTISDQLLRKLFSMSIYNALVGNDRSLDKLCELLNKPRNKKDAKRYYQIDTDQIEYQSQKEELVSEDQIQNILNYYKKIGSNERKCVQAFDSISKQYDNTQLRIIVKFLPMDVKAILEAHSPVYQRLMSNGTVLSNGQYSPYRPNNPNRPEKIEISTKSLGNSELRNSKPVIIPTNMGTTNNDNQSNNMQQNNGTQQQTGYTQQYSQYRQYGPYGQRTPSYNQQYNPYGRTSQYNNIYGQQGYSYGANPYNSTQQRNSYYGQYNNGYMQQNQQKTQQQNNNNTTNNTSIQQNTEKKESETLTNNIETTSKIENNINETKNNDLNKIEDNSVDTNTNLINEPIISDVKEENSVNTDIINSENKDESLGTTPIETVEEETVVAVEPVKRKRGRPRKLKPTEDILPSVNDIVANSTKRRRGRPPKKIAKPTNETTETNEINDSAYSNVNEQNNNAVQHNIDNYNRISQQNSEIDLNKNTLNNTQNSFDSNFLNNTMPTIIDENTAISTKNSDTSLSQLNNNSTYTNKTEPIKPINLYDLDINNDDFNYTPSKSFDNNLGIEPIENIENKSEDYSREPIAGNGKIVSFVGTSKNGTSFIVNNLALLLSQSGINTAIVDLTKNKNSYYMFTDNDAQKTKTAAESLKKLSEGIVNGLNVKNNLTVFTALPEDISTNDINNRKVLESLTNMYDVILLDCDFKTDSSYFVFANEIYLIQSMDAFTIQPLTKFLSDLKLKNILDENKLRIVINKFIKNKRLDEKMIVGGMSKYNEPSMTLQRDLFDPKKIMTMTIPFDNNTYVKYLESIALCQLSLNGYSKEVIDGLEKLKNMVYPLVAGGNRRDNGYDNYSNNDNMYNNQRDSQQFSSDINDTLNKMRKNNY